MSRIEKRLLTIKETAVYLSRSDNSVRHMVWRGEIPYVKTGRRVFFDLKDLDIWIDSHKVKETY